MDFDPGRQVAVTTLLFDFTHTATLMYCHVCKPVKFATQACEHRLFNSAAERVMCNLRHRLFSHLMNQEIGFFDRIRTGELMNRLSEVPAHLQAKLEQMSLHLSTIQET